MNGYELYSLSVPLSRVLWTVTSYIPCLSPLSRVLWTSTRYILCLSPSHVYCERVRVIFLVCPPLTCIVDWYELRSLSVPPPLSRVLWTVTSYIPYLSPSQMYCGRVRVTFLVCHPSHVYCGRIRITFLVCPPLTCIVDGYELYSLSDPFSHVLWTGTSYILCLFPLSRVLWTGTS